MTPPAATAPAKRLRDGHAPAVSRRPISILRKRSDFLAAAKAMRQSAPSFLLQGRQRAGEERHDGIRVGFTCSKKVGNAVARNRAKRRLREVARLELPDHGRDDWDYVLIGRRNATAERNFSDLRADLVDALARIHGCRQ